jgi:4-diphosphocytidyl-2-C-methyl-D-erythritol kinase
MPLLLTSPCKVNLLLNILGKRPDGFHELETVMQPVALCDSIALEQSGPGIALSCSDPSLPVDNRNLVYRAAEAFFLAASLPPSVKIHLEKRIPMAAGLGGGSGNAATTLAGLNQLYDHPLEASRVASLAAALGSDVPFFLQSGPALATGRGELIKPLPPFPALRGFQIILAHPGFGIATAWAYQQLARFPDALNGRPGRADRLVEALQSGARAAAPEFYNSLEAPALRKYPLLRLFQKFFRDEGATATLMSGSGSTTFALVPDAESAARLAGRFQRHFGDKIQALALPLEG